MKSVKPGRAPSMMSGIVGIFMVVFGIGWTITAIGMGAPWFFGLFGIVWTGIAVMNTIYNFKNATGKNRYSTYDIVDSREEPDPFNQRFGSGSNTYDYNTGTMPEYNTYGSEPDYDDGTVDSIYCPFCGAKVHQGFEYCNQCGKKLP